ncbi:MAG: YitT family protein [Bacteroidales bacterium]|nr:YitT family protein [Bacteroidales bacterium]
MKTNKKNILAEIRRYVIITLALLMMAFGWTAFLIPNHVLGGGVSGIATLIFYATGLSTGISVFVINGILVLISLKVLGPSFGIKTVYSIIVASLFMSVLQHYLTEPMLLYQENPLAPGAIKPFVDDKFLAALIGGALAGTAIGIAFTQGGSTGGTDIVAMMVCKYRNISQGKVILFLDIIIIASSYFVLKDDKIQSIIYGYVVMGVCSYCIDLVLTGNKQSVQAFIFTSEPEKVAERISNEMHRGVTLIKGTGWYTKHEGPILMVVTHKREAQQILRIVKDEDPAAFMTMNMVMGAYGKGFEMIKN